MAVPKIPATFAPTDYKFCHRIYLIRHGESMSNAELLSTGKMVHNVDVDLTPRGYQQATEIATYLARKNMTHITAIECSPMTRAWKTALPTIKRWQDAQEYPQLSNLVVDVDLREKYSGPRCLGRLPNFLPILWHNCVTSDDWDYWQCEPQANFKEQVDFVMHRWRQKGSMEDPQQTLVFTHSLFIAEILSSENQFHLSNGSITVIDFDANRNLHVHTVNSITHLSDPSGLHSCIS